MTELSPRARALLDAARSADELGDEHKARLRAAVAAAIGATAAGAASASAATVAGSGVAGAPAVAGSGVAGAPAATVAGGGVAGAPAATLGSSGSFAAIGGGAGLGGGAAIATTAAGLGTAGKLAVVAAFAGAIGGGGYAVREIASAPPAAVQSFDAAAERRAEDAPSPAPEPEPEPAIGIDAPTDVDSEASSAEPVEAATTDPATADLPEPSVAAVAEVAEAPRRRARARVDLASELELIDRARTHLRAGDATGALASLDRHDSEFASGALSEERDALRVEALCAAGRDADAEAVAAQFLARWPSSPHRDRVAGGCGARRP